jgi:hypothetical protein
MFLLSCFFIVSLSSVSTVTEIPEVTHRLSYFEVYWKPSKQTTPELVLGKRLLHNVLSSSLALRNTVLEKVYKGRGRLSKCDEKLSMRFDFSLRMNDLPLRNGVCIV